MHHDEAGHPCTQHPESADAIMAFATIGARVAAFNHDIASKMQGLMMALDEIDELLQSAPNADLRRACETAQAALRDANALLGANRQLTRTTTRTKVALRDLVKDAGSRVAVTVRGEIFDGQVELVAALTAQAIGIALDAIAGTGRGRVIDVAATREGDRAHLVFSSSAAVAKTAGDAFAIAAHVIGNAGGSLRCGQGKLIVELPIS